MGDLRLRRAVWLTSSQRRRLRLAVEEVVAEAGDHDLLPSLLAELILVEGGNERFDARVRSVIRGLRMPRDARPVQLCDAQIDELAAHGLLDEEILRVVKPAPDRYPDLEAEGESL